MKYLKYVYLNKCEKSDRLLIYEKNTEVFGSIIFHKMYLTLSQHRCYIIDNIV